MKENFIKFPSTPHLTTLPGVEVRDDKVFNTAEREDFLSHELRIEEKVDGANLGLSFDAEGNIQAQNRGAYLHLPGSGQWKKLEQWIEPHLDGLFEVLGERYILFGEWCYAQHSVHYDQLPDWFLGFDLYDKQAHRFLSAERRNALFQHMQIAQVPELARGHFTLEQLQDLMRQSKLSDHPAEGLYLRFDEGDWLAQRAKLVRAGFIQAMEQHWARTGIRPNQLCYDRHA